MSRSVLFDVRVWIEVSGFPANVFEACRSLHFPPLHCDICVVMCSLFYKGYMERRCFPPAVCVGRFADLY